jgi:hypothetical protein
MEVAEVALALHPEAAELLFRHLQWRQLETWYRFAPLFRAEDTPAGRSTIFVKLDRVKVTVPTC